MGFLLITSVVLCSIVVLSIFAPTVLEGLIVIAFFLLIASFGLVFGIIALIVILALWAWEEATSHFK